MINTIVIDTEDLNTTPAAVILSIGGFAFDVTDVAQTQRTILQLSRDQEPAQYSPLAFYGLVDSFDQLMMGRTVSRETQKWWRAQGEEAHEALAGERLSLGEHLRNLTRWISLHPHARIFFRGTDFDGSILENAYRMCGMECPWKYNGKRDVRTYIDAMTKGTKGYIENHQPCFVMIPHNALHDAMNDAEQMSLANRINDQAVLA